MFSVYDCELCYPLTGCGVILCPTAWGKATHPYHFAPILGKSDTPPSR